MIEAQDRTETLTAPAAGTPSCFLCGAVLRADHGEPINGGEDVDLCRPCGAIYEYPALCC